jgi:GMP synthase-like glutamine amidotransferase
MQPKLAWNGERRSTTVSIHNDQFERIVDHKICSVMFPARRILAIEHESDSGPAMLAERAEELGFEVTVINAHNGVPTSIDGFDGLLVMGAVPSVNDADIQHWFQPELALLRDADAKAIPIFGVCFGAQALAVALGGSVHRAAEPEIGWFEMETTDSELVPAGPFFEWHVDAIQPPVDAIVIARTPVCVQAYRIRKHLAVQFHPEVTDVQIGEWADSDPETLAALGLSKAGLLESTATQFPAARHRANALCDHFLSLASSAVNPGQNDRFRKPLLH